MIVKEDFLKKLRSVFDLNIYEVKIWTALLSKGIATAVELSDISDVPRSRCYDVLETLEKKSFILMNIGKPIKYMAVKPEEILKRVKKGLMEETDERIRVLEKARETPAYQELELLYKQGIDNVDPTTLSGSIRGRNNIYNQLSGMIENAKKSVVISTTSKGLVRKTEMLKSALKKLKSKNVKIRIAAPLSKEGKDVINDFKGLAEVKDLDLNARFVLVDGKELMFMVMNDENVHESYDVGVWVDTPYFTSALEKMFNNHWR